VLQTEALLSFIGFILIFVGAMLLVIGMTRRMAQSSGDGEQDREHKSRGVVLIGPIPIVWGFGNRGRLIMAVLFVLVMVVWLILFL